mgnify:CR=1 FL=1
MTNKVEIQGGTVPHVFQLLIPYPLVYNNEEVLVKQVTLREITGKEEEILLSRRFDAADKLVKLIANCLTEIKGIKKDGSPVSIDLVLAEEVVKGLSPLDKTYLYIMLRVISLGEEYSFEYTCSNPDCQSKNLVKVNLLSDVKFEPPKQIEYEYTVTLPSGKQAVCRLPLGKQSDYLARIPANDPGVLNKMIFARLVSLDGKSISLQEIVSLGLRDRDYLFKVFNEKEGTIDSSLELVCPKCNTSDVVDIDFSQLGFFYPSRIKI